jgi:exoribonuclease-2
VDLDPEGEIAGVEIVPSWVRVTRLTYEEAESRLAEEPFRSLWRLARIRRARREAQGAFMLDLPEVKIQIQDGEVIFHPILPLRSRELVTEAMLMAGEAIARRAVQRDLAIPFTIQDPPDTDDRPRDLAGMVRLRRVLRPSQPSSVPAPHSGLGLEAYVQATSPLRRYLDLVVHQQLRAHQRGEGLLGAHGLQERIGAAEAALSSVRQAERLARRHWTLVYLSRHPGWRGEAIMAEQRGRVGIMLIPELNLDVRVHLRQDLPLNSRVELALRTVYLPTLETNFEVLA